MGVHLDLCLAVSEVYSEVLGIYSGEEVVAYKVQGTSGIRLLVLWVELTEIGVKSVKLVIGHHFQMNMLQINNVQLTADTGPKNIAHHMALFNRDLRLVKNIRLQ